MKARYTAIPKDPNSDREHLVLVTTRSEHVERQTVFRDCTQIVRLSAISIDRISRTVLHFTPSQRMLDHIAGHYSRPEKEEFNDLGKFKRPADPVGGCA